MIGANARRIREEQGLSLDDVCDRVNALTDLNWVAGTLSKLESGKRRVRVPELAVLCQALETGALDLLTGSDELAAPWAGWTGSRMAAQLLRGIHTGEGITVTQIPTSQLEELLGPLVLDDRVAEQRRKRQADELDQVIARALGLDPEDLPELQAVAFQEFGRDALDERDATVDVFMQQIEDRGVEYDSSRWHVSQARLRASATKSMISQLRESQHWRTITFESPS